MGGFSADTFEKLDYDFTKIPKNSGEGFCTGKGTIPEPSDEMLQEFQKGAAEDAAKLMGGSVSQQDLLRDPAKLVDLVSRTAETRKATEKRLAKLCRNSPSEKELSELPPRYFNGFANWLTDEVGSPTRATAATSL